MLDEEVRNWLVSCGELVTITTRVLRECSGMCVEYSLKYLLLLASLEFKRLCSYLEERFGRCYEVIHDVCGKDLASSLSKILDISEVLVSGAYVGVDDLFELTIKLPELYACGSRSIFEFAGVTPHAPRKTQ